MATQHLPETEVDSVCSSPRSDQQYPRWNDEPQPPQPRVRFMCSFGGRILPRPHDNQLRYVGGETRIVAVHRSATFASLLAKLAKLAGYSSSDFAVKYQLPTEDLDALISVSTDEDVDNMVEEYDRLCLSLSAASPAAAAAARTPRLRLFLFPHGGVSRSSSSISSLLDGAGAGSSKQWFVDALNGSGRGSLERVRSEVSSVVSEVPDYLFGLDNESSETAAAKTGAMGRIFRGGAGTGNGNGTHPDQNRSAMADPGSPAPPVAPTVYFSTSSTTMMPPSDHLPPVKTKVETSAAAMNNIGQAGGVDEQPAAVNDMRYAAVDQQPPLQRTTTAPILMWPPQQAQYYPEAHHLQGQMPVYYMPTPGGNVPVRPVQMPLHSAYMHGVAGQGQGQPTYYGGQPMMVNQMGAPPPPAQAPVYGGQILRPGIVPTYPPAGVGTDHYQVLNNEAKTG